MFPIGWDAFGLPTENYAIKMGVHPQDATKQNIKNFRKQVNALGLRLRNGLQKIFNSDIFAKGTVQGLGLMIAVNLESQDYRNELMQKCCQDGLLILPAANTAVRILLPLNSTFELVDEVLAILEKNK